MNFLFLGNFSGFLNRFSYFIFDFKSIFNKLKKNARGARVDATWHSGPRGSATRTRAAPTWRVFSILYILYILYSLWDYSTYNPPIIGGQS